MSERSLVETDAVSVLRRPWRRNLALGLIILVCGAVIGSMITAVTLRRGPMHEMRRMEDLPQKIASEMRREFGLSAEQEQQLKGIFEEHGKKLSDIRREVQPRVESEHESLRKAVETVLTPEQAGKWQKKFDQMRKPWMHHRDKPAEAESR